MKVTTDLHSGALADSVAQAAQSLSGQVGEFFTAAQDQAAMVTDRAAGVFTGFWDAVRGVFR